MFIFFYFFVGKPYKPDQQACIFTQFLFHASHCFSISLFSLSMYSCFDVKPDHFSILNSHLYALIFLVGFVERDDF